MIITLFFIFLKDEKDEVIKEFNIKQLIKKINENKKKNKIKNTRKLDSRNISCETKDIFNYFNENDEKILILILFQIMINLIL